VQVGPENLDRRERPHRGAPSVPPPGQEEENGRNAQKGEHVRPFHEARGRQEDHEGERRNGHDRRRCEQARRGVEQGRHRDRRQRLEQDETIPPEGRLDEAEQDARQPLVGDEGAPARQGRVVVDARHAPGLQDRLAGFQVEEDVVVGDRRDGQGEQQEGQRREGGRLAAPDGAGITRVPISNARR